MGRKHATLGLAQNANFACLALFRKKNKGGARDDQWTGGNKMRHFQESSLFSSPPSGENEKQDKNNKLPRKKTFFLTFCILCINFSKGFFLSLLIHAVAISSFTHWSKNATISHLIKFALYAVKM